jgi:glucokinase
MSDQKVAIGIDIGGTNTKIGVIDTDGETLEYQVFPTQGDRDFSEYSARLILRIQEILTHINEKQILGIGIGAPNANPKSGCIENPPNINWTIAPIIQELKKAFPNIEILLENDANIAAYGEKYFGLAKKLNHFVVITLGTGLGSGLFANNHLVAGEDHTGGEAGHITIVPNGRKCHCGGRGHFESYVSVYGIQTTAQEIFNRELEFKEITHLLKEENPKAIEVFRKTTDYLALGLASIASLLKPDRMILTGGVSSYIENFMPQLTEEFNTLVYPQFKGKVPISVSNIASKKGAVFGAASIIFHQFQ